MARILFPSLNEGKKCKLLLGYLDANDKKTSSWEFECNLLCQLNLYLDIRTRYISNMKTFSLYNCNQKRNKAENKWCSFQWRYLFIFLFLESSAGHVFYAMLGNTSLLLQHFWINFWCSTLLKSD